MNNRLRLKYFELRKNLAELLQKANIEKHDSVGLGLSHGVVYFDDFKLEITCEGLEEITLHLYLNGNEVANINIEYMDSFNIYLEDVSVDFVEGVAAA